MGVGAVFSGLGQVVKNIVSYDPEGKTVKYSSIILKNEQGHDFARLSPSLYNLASSAASGSFSMPGTEEDLLKGKGNISNLLRQKAKLESKMDKLVADKAEIQRYLSQGIQPDSMEQEALAKCQALTSEIKILNNALTAWNVQIKYLRALGRSYIQFNTWKTFVDYEQAVAKHHELFADIDPSDKKYQKSMNKLEKKLGRLKLVVEGYYSVLERDPYLEGESGNIFRDVDFMNPQHGVNRFKPQWLSGILDPEQVATDAMRPGVFASQAELDAALKTMVSELRGKDLPKEALILLPANPSHHKILGYVKKHKAKELENRVPTDIAETNIKLEKSWYQFTPGEKILPAISFVFSVIFTAATTAMMGAFMFALFTPLGVPLWAIGVMAATVFLIDLSNNRDDFQGRTARILDPFKRVFNSLVYPHRFDNRPNERLSIPRALLTGFLLFVIGFDISMVAVGGALGFKEFSQNQALARIHPVGMILMTAVLGIWFFNSMISPFFGEALSRIGLFFREPMAVHKYDVAKELPVILINRKCAESSDQAAALSNDFVNDYNERQVEAWLMHQPAAVRASSSSEETSPDLFAGPSVRVATTASNVVPFKRHA